MVCGRSADALQDALVAKLCGTLVVHIKAGVQLAEQYHQPEPGFQICTAVLSEMEKLSQLGAAADMYASFSQPTAEAGQPQFHDFVWLSFARIIHAAHNALPAAEVSKW